MSYFSLSLGVDTLVSLGGNKILKKTRFPARTLLSSHLCVCAGSKSRRRTLYGRGEGKGRGADSRDSAHKNAAFSALFNGVYLYAGGGCGGSGPARSIPPDGGGGGAVDERPDSFRSPKIIFRQGQNIKSISLCARERVCAFRVINQNVFYAAAAAAG